MWCVVTAAASQLCQKTKSEKSVRPQFHPGSVHPHPTKPRLIFN